MCHIPARIARIALTRLRLSAHNLAIETGMYHPRIERHRHRQCNQQLVEDECHFTLVCAKHDKLRRAHIPAYYRQGDDTKFTQLMKDVQLDK